MNVKKKSILLAALALVISLCMTLLAVYLYRHLHASAIIHRMIQNVTYLLMLLSTLVFMKISRKSLREFGLFKDHLPRQILIGILIALIFMIIPFLTGWRLVLKENVLYIIFSQMLVAFSEELLFRGFILTMLKDVIRSKNMAVFIAALLFGLWHYPLGQNMGQVISACFVGTIFGALRTTLDDTDAPIGVPSIAIAHWIFNVMMS